MGCYQNLSSHYKGDEDVMSTCGVHVWVQGRLLHYYQKCLRLAQWSLGSKLGDKSVQAEIYQGYISDIIRNASRKNVLLESQQFTHNLTRQQTSHRLSDGFKFNTIGISILFSRQMELCFSLIHFWYYSLMQTVASSELYREHSSVARGMQ